MDKSGTTIFPTKSDQSRAAEPNASNAPSELESKAQSPRVDSETHRESKKTSLTSNKKVSIAGELPTEKHSLLDKDRKSLVEKERRSSIVKSKDKFMPGDKNGEFKLQPPPDAQEGQALQAQNEANVSKSSVRLESLALRFYNTRLKCT